MTQSLYIKLPLFGALLVAPSLAFADCTNPAAVESATFYNTSVNAIQFCNGSQWVNTGLKVPTATGTSCANPTADEGAVYYNTTVNNIQFCNGDNWIKMGTGDYSSATGTACTSPAAPEGSMFYNTSYKRLQFCNGDGWVNATYYPTGEIEALELHKIVASDGAASDEFGVSVFIDGANIVVGSYKDDDDGSESGSAYIFNAVTGAQVHKLTASDGASGDRFGINTSISNGKALIGAYFSDDAGSESGSAYIFDAVTGTQLHKLTASDAAAGDRFGINVGISGNYAIVGSYHDGANGTESGSAYIFDVSTGTQLHKLMASDGAAYDEFSYSVAISGKYAVVGARYDNNKGAAYVFDVTTGEQVHKLTASDGASGDRFGISVSISGDKVIVGADQDDDKGADSGSAYIFDVATGAQLFKLTASDGSAGDRLGISVGIHNNKAVAGSFLDDDNGSDSGSVYVFDATTGDQLNKLTASNGAGGDHFGYNLSVSDGRIIASSRFHASNGAAYIFD